MRKIATVVLVACALLALPFTARAAEYRVPSSENGNVTVSKGEAARNLYAAGANVTTESDVGGDFLAAGGNININSKVERGLAAVGGNISLRDEIGQTARLAGGNIFINGKTNDDLLAAGGTVNLDEASEVKGDLWVAGQTLTVAGNIGGEVRAYGGDVTLNSEIGGDVYLGYVDNLTLGEKAVIGGRLQYVSPQEAIIASQAQVKGGIDYTYRKSPGSARFALAGLAGWLKILSAFVLLVVLFYLFPRPSRHIISEVNARPLPLFGIGLLAVIAPPLAILLLLSSLIGMKIALVLAIIYIAWLTLAGVYTAGLVGSVVVRWLRKDKDYSTDWLAALVGAVISTLVAFIPFLGGTVIAVLFLLSLGALADASYKQLLQARQKN